MKTPIGVDPECYCCLGTGKQVGFGRGHGFECSCLHYCEYCRQPIPLEQYDEGVPRRYEGMDACDECRACFTAVPWSEETRDCLGLGVANATSPITWSTVPSGNPGQIVVFYDAAGGSSPDEPDENVVVLDILALEMVRDVIREHAAIIAASYDDMPGALKGRALVACVIDAIEHITADGFRSSETRKT